MRHRADAKEVNSHQGFHLILSQFETVWLQLRYCLLITISDTIILAYDVEA